jgi:uncharacterized protein
VVPVLSLALALVFAQAPPAACTEYGAVVAGAPVPGNPADCARLLAEACDAGRAAGCAAYGRLLDAGAGVPADPARALAYHRRACDAGVADACARAASGLAAAGDAARARAALVEGCAVGSGRACRQLADATGDAAERARLRERACDLRDGPACLALADAEEETGGVHALARYERACRAGGARGCLVAGEARRFGAAGRPDAGGARELLARGCGLGSGEACARLGLLLLDAGGPGAQEGRALLSAACPALPPKECVAAARRWLGGAGAAAGPDASPSLLDAACADGAREACTRLGRLYQEGMVVAADGARAAALYRVACDADDAGGCTALGVLFRFGAGVPRDEARARELLGRGCALGDREGCRLRDDPVRPADAAPDGAAHGR